MTFFNGGRSSQLLLATTWVSSNRIPTMISHKIGVKLKCICFGVSSSGEVAGGLSLHYPPSPSPFPTALPTSASIPFLSLSLPISRRQEGVLNLLPRYLINPLPLLFKKFPSFNGWQRICKLCYAANIHGWRCSLTIR